MTVGFRSLLFTLCIPGSATVWIPWLLVSQRIPPESTVPLSMRLPGGFLIATGAVLYCACLWDFTFTGLGTPAVWDPPVVFVSKGPYRFARNPMYLAIVSILMGEALLFRSIILAWTGVTFAVGFHFFVVFYEERALKQRFGSSYEHYCSQVSRWLPWWPAR